MAAFRDVTNSNGLTGSSLYTESDTELVRKAKEKHRETTASAQRAAKTAEKTKELANNTLNELHRQGQKLELVDRDLQEIDADVKESKSLLAYMRRCCLCFLFICCCDCDPDKDRDATRKQRVKGRKAARQDEAETYQKVNQARKTDSAFQRPVDNDKARSELLAKENAAERVAAKRQGAYRIGEGLEDADRAEIVQQTTQQEKYLNQIDDALDDLHRLGREMGEELGRQDVRLNDVRDKTEVTHDQLRGVSRDARRDFKLR